ncbi:MAG: hypothetical protein V1808_04605, partial [Candidatus Daviesbacteria bacterium]
MANIEEVLNGPSSEEAQELNKLTGPLNSEKKPDFFQKITRAATTTLGILGIGAVADAALTGCNPTREERPIQTPSGQEVTLTPIPTETRISVLALGGVEKYPDKWAQEIFERLSGSNANDVSNEDRLRFTQYIEEQNRKASLTATAEAIKIPTVIPTLTAKVETVPVIPVSEIPSKLDSLAATINAIPQSPDPQIKPDQFANQKDNITNMVGIVKDSLAKKDIEGA